MIKCIFAMYDMSPNAPIRALTTSWSSEFKAENRVHASSFQTDHRTLAGGVESYMAIIFPDASIKLWI